MTHQQRLTRTLRRLKQRQASLRKNFFRPLSRGFERLEDRSLLAVSITEFTIPTLNSQPYGITAGPDGNLWFTEDSGNKIGRITTAGVVTAEFVIPTANSQPTGITSGPDGNLWFAEYGSLPKKIARLTPAGVFTEFPLASPVGAPVSLTTGPDGNVWFTVAGIHHSIGRITPSGVITEFPTPTFEGAPYGITTGPDGNIWFTQLNGNKIGRITPSGVITEFTVPSAVNIYAVGITSGPDGNLWFTEQGADKIGRITPTGTITQFDLASGTDPYGITAAPDGNLWFGESGTNKIGRITPAGVITEFTLPTAASRSNNLAVGPDGNLWFTEYAANKIGRLTFAVTWDGGGGDLDWNNPANWSADALPANGDDVIIPDLLGTPTITSSGTVGINSLIAHEELSITGGSFSVIQPPQLDLGVTVSGGIFLPNGLSSSSNVTVASGATAAVTAIPSSGLVGLWHAEENALDAVGGNNGVFGFGATTVAGGKVGRAFFFDGGADYVQTADAPSLEMSTQFTLSAWIKPNNVDNYQQIISKFGASGNYAYQFGLAPGGSLRSDISADGTTYDFLVSGGGEISTGVWTHVAATFNGGALKLFVNGIEVASKTSTVTTIFDSGNANPTIGSDSTSSQTIDGLVDVPAIHSRDLSLAEIQASMAGGTLTQSAGTTTVAGVLHGGIGLQGGILKGTGTIHGDVENSSIVRPGNSPGIITVNGNYSQSETGALDIEIAGTSAATPDFDQLIVNGTVTLDGALNVSFLSGYAAPAGATFWIIDNDLADAITTTFAGLNEGATFSVGPSTFQISYVGGTGNDVVLTATSGPIVWDGGQGTLNWNDANNWSGNVLPGVNDDVVIPDLSGTQTITSSGTVSIRSLVTAEKLAITGGTFTVSQASQLNGGLDQSGGTLTGNGALTLAGNNTWTGGTLSGTGSATLAAGSVTTLNVVAGMFLGRGLTNHGTATWSGAGVSSAAGGSWTNAPGSTFNVTVPLAGTNFDPAFTNQAGATVNCTGTSNGIFHGVFANAGTVNINGGTLTLSGGGTNSGAITGAGVLRFEGGTHTLTSTSSVTTASVIFFAGTVTVDGIYDVATLTQGTGGGPAVTFNPAATVLSFGTTLSIDFGTYTFNSGEDVSVQAFSMAGGTLTGGDNLTVTGDGNGGTTDFNWTAGTISGVGTTTLAAGSTSTIGTGTTKNLSRPLVNFGAVNWGLTTVFGGGTFTNKSGGTFNANSNANDFSPIFVNEAGAILARSGTNTARFISALTNHGDINVNSGTLSFSSGSSGAGNFSTASGATLSFDGGTHNINGTYNAAGVTQVTLGTVNWNSAATVAAIGERINLTGGTATFSSGELLTTSSLVVQGGTLGGADSLTVAGDSNPFTFDFTWSGGTMSGSGTTTLAAAATAEVTTGVSRNLQRAWTVAGSVTHSGAGNLVFNNGTLNISSGADYQIQTNAGFSVAGGTNLVNNAGEFAKGGAGTGTSLIATPLNNLGEVLALSGTLSFTGSPFTQLPSPFTTLTGGTWTMAGGTILLPGATLVATNQGTLVLGSTTSESKEFNSLSSNTGTLTVTNNSGLVTTGALANSGTTAIAAGSTLGVGATPTSGLISLWHAEGNAFDAFDGNPGTLTNGATATGSGKVGQAFSLDGANDYVNIGDPASGNLDFGAGAFTLDFWVKPTAYGGVLINKGSSALLPAGNRSGYFLYLTPTGALHAEVSSWDANILYTTAATTDSIPLGQWTHVAFVRTAASIQFYFNGVAKSATAGGNAAPSQVLSVSNVAPFRIGTRDTGTSIGVLGAFFNGSLDEVTVHNSALSQPEIQSAMTDGAYTQTSGTTTVNGSLAASSVTVQGGTLSGSGTINGSLTNQSNVSPGNSPGVITVNGDYVQTAGANLNIEIQGTNPTTPDYDQLFVNGAVTLDGSLNISFLPLATPFVPASGDSFRIITNDGVDEISPFPSLPEGSLFSVSGTTFLITYHGGDGNDLELIVPTAAASEVSLDNFGNLVISGSSGAELLTLWSDSANSRFVVQDDANVLSTSIAGSTGSGTGALTIPFAAVTGGQIRAFTLDGDDSLRVNYSLGNFAKGINFYAGMQITGDSLTLAGGGSFASVAHTFANNSDGSVAVAGNGLVFYTGLEPLADNLIAANRIFTFNGGAETITLAAAGGANMTIASTLGKSITFPSPAASLTINAGTGSDVISINSLAAAFTAALTIDGGAAADTVTLALPADLTLAAGNSLTVAAETISVAAGTDLTTSGGGTISFTADDLSLGVAATLNAGTSTVTLQTATAGREIDLGSETAGRLSLTDAELDQITARTLSIGNASSGAITVSAAISHSGDKNFVVTTGRNIAFNSGTSWTTTNGNLTFNANPSGTMTGNLVGILVDAATIQSNGTGNISLTGRGGIAPSSFNNMGIQVINGGSIQSTFTGSGAGSITLDGTGSSGMGSLYGVWVVGANSRVTTQTGDISITGRAGAGNGTDWWGIGVNIQQGGSVRSSGSGDITINGTGAFGGHHNPGVWIDGGVAVLSTSSGNISITGQGGGRAGFSEGSNGVSITNGGIVQSTGTGLIAVTGTGGIGAASDFGVWVVNSNSRITSATGDIAISGQAGTTGGQYDIGVVIQGGGKVESTGVGASAAKITINGVGAGGSNFNAGIWLQDLSNAISSVDGNVTLTGTATDSTGTGNDGVRILSGGGITITGNASLTTTGTAASSDPTGSDSFGINVGAGASTSVLSLAGTSTTFIADSMNIASTATINAAANTVTLRPNTNGKSIGLGAADSSSTLGLTDAELDRITAGTLSIGNASSGAITVSAAISHTNNLTLTTGGGITFNQAVTMAADKSFAATSTSAATAITLANTNADITTSGTGAVSLASARNILLVAGSSVTTVNGGIAFTANPTGTATGNFNGILVDGATVQTLGAGNLLLTGFGGDQAGTINNSGVHIANSGLVQTAGAGTITLDGTAGTGTQFNSGVVLFASGTVNSTAAATGKITLIGHAASSTGSDNCGITIGGGGLLRSQGSGDLELTGFGGTSTSFNNYGVYLDSSIQSSGTGKITISGTGGTGVSGTVGVIMFFGLISSASGDVSITGTGGTASSENSAGILIAAGADIQSTGGAKITLDGTAGIGQPWGTFGTWLADDGTTITSNAGDIHLIGTGGAGSGDWNMGTWISRGAILATGNAQVTIEGTGGGGVSHANGVAFERARVTAVNGDITIEGHGGLTATGIFNRGVGVFDGTLIQSTGTAAINLIGFGGGGDIARGVELGSSGANITRVLSATGDITITGQGGPANADHDAQGIIIHSGTVIESTATASITIDGTGGSGNFGSEGVGFSGFGAVGATRVRSVDGDITITGRGGNAPAGRYNRGVGIYSQTVIQSTGNATITIDGTASAGLGDERGVEIGDAGTKVTSARGDISIIGRGAAGTDPVITNNVGVLIRSSAVVESTATSGTAAKITIEGTGGAGSEGNFGVWLSGSPQIMSVLGDVFIDGQGGAATGANSFGIWLQAGSSVVSTGAAKITLHGTGGSGTQGNMGIWALNSSIRTHDGDIQLTGLGGAGTTSINFGVDVSASTVESTGLGDIRIHGTGGTGDSYEMGVRLFYAETRIRSTFGDIEVVGIGGGNPTGTSIFNAGVALVGGRIEALPGGDAAVTVTGTGGMEHRHRTAMRWSAPLACGCSTHRCPSRRPTVRLRSPARGAAAWAATTTTG